MNVDEVISALRKHGNLSKACRDLGHNRTSFMDMVAADELLADRYARAKLEGIDQMMEDVLDEPIADPAVGRLDWDRKRWHASKLFAKKYGDKLDVTSGGEKLDRADAMAAARKRVDE